MYQKFAWAYVIFFFAVVTLGHIPGLTDDSGMLLGLFMINLRDDLLHTFSGLWALYGALNSPFQARRYFRWFGLFYTVDAFVGFFTGYAIIDLFTGNFGANVGYQLGNVGHNLLANLPHFVIGPSALFIGYLLNDKVKKSRNA